MSTVDQSPHSIEHNNCSCAHPIMWKLAMCLCAVVGTAAAAVEQIMLSYGATDSEISFSFAAFSDETSAEFWFGTSQSNLTQMVTVTGAKYTQSDYTSPMLYKGKVTGLTAGNQLYYYSAGSKALGYSEVNYFKSHPGIGAEDVTFHIFGDLGQTANSQSTLEELVSYDNDLNSKSGGIVSMGDLSYADRDEPLWDSFGSLITIASGHIPMLTTQGNHEWSDTANHDFTAYKSRFNNPDVNGQKELYYSYDSGLVHWVMVAGYCKEMLSVYTQPCLAEGSPQMDWLQKDLASVDRSVTPWVVAVFHQPYVNSNVKHAMATEGAPMQKAIEDTLNQYHVDVVFSGHVHAYERSCQVYQYKCQAGAPYYITIGDGGNAEGLASNWIEPQPEWSVFRQASYGFGELRAVNSSTMTWRWHQNQDLLPVIADEFTFTKEKDSHSAQQQRDTKPVTRKPMFADSERGRKAAAFNEKVINELAAAAKK